jgi:hypothetical protein
VHEVAIAFIERKDLEISKTMSSPVEQELNAIRLKNYERTKDMTTSERADYLHKKVEDGLRRHGYKLVPIDSTGASRLVRI